MCAGTPAWERIGECVPIFGREFVIGHKAGIEAGADYGFVHSNADKHQRLAPIAPNRIPVWRDMFFKAAIVRPLVLGHRRPPPPKPGRNRLATGDGQIADPLWPCRKPE